MKITFLGTSHGRAEVGRYCSATHIEYNGFGFVIDSGAPIEYALKMNGIDETSVGAYFLTHMHADHVGTLPDVAKMYLGWKRPMSADIYFPEKRAIEPFRAWISALHMKEDPERLRFHSVTPGIFYKGHGITVTAIRTEHISKDIETYAYMIETEDGKRVLFTGDMSHDFHDYPSIAKESEFDLVVSELTHLSADKACEILKGTKTKCMIFSHVYPRNVTMLEEKNISFDFPHIVASDGFIYKL